MNDKKAYIRLILCLFLCGCFTQSASEISYQQKLRTENLVEWCMPSDCHSGHACGCNGEKSINGLVKTECCHGSHACGSRYGRAVLSKGDTPTQEDYDRVMGGEIFERVGR